MTANDNKSASKQPGLGQEQPALPDLRQAAQRTL